MNKDKSIYKKTFFYFAIVIGVGTISAIISLLVPILIGSSIDNTVVNNGINFKNIIQILFFYTIIFILETLLAVLTVKLSNLFVKRIRNELFKKMQNLPMSYIDKKNHGELLSIFTVSIENILIAILQALPKIVNGIIIVIGAVFIMVNINLVMASITIIFAPIMYFITRFITKKTNSLFKSRGNIISKLNGLTQEGITEQKTIRNFNYQEKSFKKFNDINEELYKIGRKAQMYSSLINPFTRFVGNLTYVIVGATGVVLLRFGEISIGTISTFFIYANLFSKPFQEITSIITELQIAFTSYKRINQFLKEKEEKKANNKKEVVISGNIVFKDVSFSYKQGSKFIENMNLTVKQGENIAIVGKTGSGKTTIANLIMRFYHIDSGEIIIDGENIENIEAEVLRKNIGIVLQDTKLFTGTVKENISYGKEDASLEDIVNAAKLAGADEFINRLPNGYDTVIDNESKLSEGEIQLITIARVILMNPPILILDEATSNVDIITENKVQQAFMKLMKSATTFIIAHRLSTIKLADRIIVIENGNIVEEGTHEELIKKKKYYYELYET